MVRASAQSSDVGGVVLSASGYIVAHHKINLNSKVTGRVKWIGVEKGDEVKEGQILVRLEDDEFRAQYDQASGAAAECQGLSSKNCRMDLVPRKFSRPSTISMKHGPHWSTTRLLSTAPAAW